MMRHMTSGASHIDLACGATDFRKQICGLTALVSLQFNLDPYNGSQVFIFCNKRKDAIKVLRYDENGFILAAKKLMDGMKVQWPRTPSEVKEISFQQVAKCSVCGTSSGKGIPCHFQKTAVPVPVLPHSIATPSLVAQVIYQKYALGLPLARQEKDWYRFGLVLPRNNMAHWIIRCSQEWLEPVYWRIRRLLMGCEVLHMDETHIQCNKEKGKKAHSQSFMWVIRSGASEDIQAAFFYYDRGRNGDIAADLLKGGNSLTFFPGWKAISRLFLMKKRKQSVRRRHGQSWTPFGHG